MLQELTNKIKKIIPEIDELKFGCNLINKQTSIDWAKNVMLLVHNIDNGTFYFKESDGSVFHQRIKFEDFENKFEIIGRDITLEDVLRCLEDTVAYKVVCSVFKNYLLI